VLLTTFTLAFCILHARSKTGVSYEEPLPLRELYQGSNYVGHGGLAGFTSAPATARSQLTSFGGSFKDRPGSRGGPQPDRSRPNSAGEHFIIRGHVL
jgi:hypothetical protein